MGKVGSEQRGATTESLGKTMRNGPPFGDGKPA
jgi:hypothetical protein